MEIVITLEHPTLPGVFVDSTGQIRIPKSGKNKAHWTFGSITKNGYRQVSIYKKHYLVHRLVAETFIPNPENKPFIDHINRDRSDNRVENLRWVTAQENQNNTIRNRQEGKHLKDFTTEKEYNADRARDRYKNEPGYKEYHREYLKKWREKKRQSM
jgi:hypothetical protein